MTVTHQYRNIIRLFTCSTTRSMLKWRKQHYNIKELPKEPTEWSVAKQI